jgi:cofilin
MSGNKANKTKFIIFKIADNKKEVVIDEVSQEEDYEVFRSKLDAARDSKGNPAPRYAVYDVEYDLGGGEGKRYDCLLRSEMTWASVADRICRSKIVFISWVPSDTPTLVWLGSSIISVKGSHSNGHHSSGP